MTVAVVATCYPLIPVFDIKNDPTKLPTAQSTTSKSVSSSLLSAESSFRHLLCLSRSVPHTLSYVLALMIDGSPGEIRTPVDGSKARH